MKNEPPVFDTSKFKPKKISGALTDPHGQFTFQQRDSATRPFVSNPFANGPFDVAAHRDGQASNSQYSSQPNSPHSNPHSSQPNNPHNSQFNASNQITGQGGPFESQPGLIGSIPPLTRIGSDSSNRSSSSSLSKRKPVGNLTPTKFEYLTNGRTASAALRPDQPRHSSELDLQRSGDRAAAAAPFNELRKELNKEQSSSLHSIRSPNLSALNSPSGSSNEDSSNRSSPDLANHQRSHHLTAYLSKHSAFSKSPDYSSSRHLFDSIQHLDVQKLISNDKRRLFCSTSTLPTVSCSTSTLLPKNAK